MRCLRCGQMITESYSHNKAEHPLCIRCMIKEGKALIKENEEEFGNLSNLPKLNGEQTFERDTFIDILNNFIALDGCKATLLFSPTSIKKDVVFNNKTDLANTRFETYIELLNCPASIEETQDGYTIVVDTSELEFTEEDIDAFVNDLVQPDGDVVYESASTIDEINYELNKIVRDFNNALQDNHKDYDSQSLARLEEEYLDRVEKSIFGTFNDLSIETVESIFLSVRNEMDEMVKNYPEYIEYQPINFFENVTEAMLEDAQRDMDIEDANSRLSNLIKDMREYVKTERESGCDEANIKRLIKSNKKGFTRQLTLILDRSHLSQEDESKARKAIEDMMNTLEFKDGNILESKDFKYSDEDEIEYKGYTISPFTLKDMKVGNKSIGDCTKYSIKKGDAYYKDKEFTSAEDAKKFIDSQLSTSIKEDINSKLYQYSNTYYNVGDEITKSVTLSPEIITAYKNEIGLDADRLVYMLDHKDEDYADIYKYCYEVSVPSTRKAKMDYSPIMCQDYLDRVNKKFDANKVAESFAKLYNGIKDSDILSLLGLTDSDKEEFIADKDVKVVAAEETNANIDEAYREPVDDLAVDELVLYIKNDSQIYNNCTMAVVKNLARKKAKGVYDKDLAVKAFEYVAKSGANKYTKEFGDTFNPATRNAVAKELLNEYEDYIEELADKKKVKESIDYTDENYLYKPYWYFTRHGMGPGSVPPKMSVWTWFETPEGTYFASSRIISKQDLSEYEIFEKQPNLDDIPEKSRVDIQDFLEAPISDADKNIVAKENLNIKEEYDVIDTYYMVDIDSDIKADSATKQEAIDIVNQAKSDVKDYVYVTRTTTYFRDGNQEKSFEDVVDAYIKEGKWVVKKDMLGVLKQTESFDPATIVDRIREFLQEYPFENEAHNTIEDFEEYIANELFNKEVSELTSEESYAISDVWEGLNESLNSSDICEDAPMSYEQAKKYLKDKRNIDLTKDMYQDIMALTGVKKLKESGSDLSDIAYHGTNTNLETILKDGFKGESVFFSEDKFDAEGYGMHTIGVKNINSLSLYELSEDELSNIDEVIENVKSTRNYDGVKYRYSKSRPYNYEIFDIANLNKLDRFDADDTNESFGIGLPESKEGK